MRVTEGRIIELSSRAVDGARQDMVDAGEQVSSGKRVRRASDDLVAWASGARAQARLVETTRHKSTIARAQEKLQIGEGALSGIGDILQRVSELAVQASSATNTERTTTAIEVRELISQAIANANTRTEDGEYLFASFANSSAPFSSAGVYSGGTSVRSVETALSQTHPGSIPGSRLTNLAGGANVNVFDVLDSIADALEADSASGVQAQLDNLKQSVRQVATARGEIGGYLNALAQAELDRFALEESMTTLKSRALDTDYVGAAEALARAKNAMEASQVAGQQLISAVALYA